MIPGCRAALSREQEDALWQQVFTVQPGRRREFEPVGRGASNQAAQETTRALAARHGLNPKTVAKWRHRTTTADCPMGPARRRSTVPTEAEEAIVVEFRRRHLGADDASRNRFIGNFHDVISMIFHYHYQWSKADEKERNIVAIQEHLAYIGALKSRDREAVAITCRAHMRTARATLLRSIERIEAR